VNEIALERKREAAERLVDQKYLRRTADGRVILTKRGKLALEQFTGGPLARDSFDLDSAYYGAVHANRRRDITWAEKFLNAWAQVPANTAEVGEDLREQRIAALDQPVLNDIEAPRPKPESTFYWMRYFHEIDEPSLERLYLGGWEGVTCWKLDVHRAVAELAKKRSRNRLLVFALYCEGWDRDEIGQLMRSMSPGEAWSDYTVNDLIKEISRHIRRRTDMQLPKSGFRDEAPTPTAIADKTLDKIRWARDMTANREHRLEARRARAKAA
jgi:hypothetical protein